MTLVVLMFYIGGIERCLVLKWGIWASIFWPHYAGKLAVEYVDKASK
jgi:hypothetical protein